MSESLLKMSEKCLLSVTSFPDFAIFLQTFPNLCISIQFASSCWSFWWLVCQNQTITKWARCVFTNLSWNPDSSFNNNFSKGAGFCQTYSYMHLLEVYEGEFSIFRIFSWSSVKLSACFWHYVVFGKSLRVNSLVLRTFQDFWLSCWQHCYWKWLKTTEICMCDYWKQSSEVGRYAVYWLCAWSIIYAENANSLILLPHLPLLAEVLITQCYYHVLFRVSDHILSHLCRYQQLSRSSAILKGIKLT